MPKEISTELATLTDDGYHEIKSATAEGLTPSGQHNKIYICVNTHQQSNESYWPGKTVKKYSGGR